jgi:hypothetical protein
MTALDQIFKFNNYSAGGVLPHSTTGGIRHLHKSFNESERNLYNDWWQEQIFQFGTEVDYYASQYSLSGHDSLYGEEPTRSYAESVKLVVAFELNESAIVLNKFGLVGDDEITGYIAIDTFYNQLSSVDNTSPEPKSGDVFKLTEYGSLDRIGGREGKIFEITDRVEQDVSKINPLIGHYIWLIKAKRFDYSFEPGLSGEAVIDQVYEDSRSGLLSGFTQPASEEKAYTDDIQLQSKDVFDYNGYFESNDDVYGGYN